MLSARENNFTQNSQFSKADARHILSRYLPVNKHYLVDQNENAPFLCEFSSDGSWLVVGYQDFLEILDVSRWSFHSEDENDFIIFAVNFSSDGQEIVCSSNDNDCNDSIYIRDLFTKGKVEGRGRINYDTRTYEVHPM